MHITGVTGPEIEGSDAFCQVILDTTVGQPLVDPGGAGFDVGKWTMVFGGNLYETVSATWLDFQRIAFAFTLIGPGFGTDHLSYSNAPSDVFDTVGNSLPATDWPLV